MLTVEDHKIKSKERIMNNLKAIVTGVTIVIALLAIVAGATAWQMLPFGIFVVLAMLSIKGENHSTKLVILSVAMFLINFLTEEPSFIDMSIWAIIGATFYEREE